MLTFNLSQAQVINNGVIKQNKSEVTHHKDTIVIDLKYEDSKGTQYPIIVNRKSGSCYVWKVSGKTGKNYRYYLPKDIKEAVHKYCKESGIDIKSREKK